MPGRVLVVDDAGDLRTLVAMVLRSAGHDVSEAGSLAAAREVLRSRPVDVLLSDVCLGEQSGLDLAAELRARDPDVRIVLHTASAAVDAATVARLGVSDVLQKPASIDQLLAAVSPRERAGRG